MAKNNSENRSYLEHMQQRSDTMFDRCEESRKYRSKELNKSVFALGTGVLAITITFIGYIKTTIANPDVLIWSWVFFLFALALQITIHYLVLKVESMQQGHIKKSIKSSFDPSWEVTIENDTDIKKVKKWLLGIEIAAIISLAFGMLCFVVFAASNLIAQNAVRQISQQTATSTPSVH